MPKANLRCKSDLDQPVPCSEIIALFDVQKQVLYKQPDTEIQSMQACMHAVPIHTYIHTHIHYIYLHIHTYTNFTYGTYIYIYIHTYTYGTYIHIHT